MGEVIRVGDSDHFHVDCFKCTQCSVNKFIYFYSIAFFLSFVSCSDIYKVLRMLLYRDISYF